MSRRFGALALMVMMVVGVLPSFAASRTTPSDMSLNGVPDAATQLISVQQLGRYIPADAELEGGAAEIVAFDPSSKRMFITNGQNEVVDIVNIADPSAPALISSIDISSYGADLTSVSFKNGVLAVAVPASPKNDPGKVVFFDATGAYLNQVTVGALPDMVTFTPDGSKVLVANEGEPVQYTPTVIDPEGSISIIDISGGVTNPLTAQTAGFTGFNSMKAALKAAGIRIFGPDASSSDGLVTVAQDLEPEYITVSADSSTAYVTLQENNAIAMVDLATATVNTIVPLGYKDYSLAGNGLDASDRDGPGNTASINISPEPVYGMYMPDSIASFSVGGNLYLVTANEGDAREYDGLVEEARVSSLTLDATAFPGSTSAFARLNVTNTMGDTDSDGAYEELYSFGARSFSIWNGSDGSLVYDSGDDLETRTAALYPTHFNADHTSNSLDNRSDNKGPEPEAATVGVIDGRTYAFIGLERFSGFAVYDVTTPTAPTFVQYVTNRNFDVTPSNATVADGSVGDLGPEGILFVSAADSPTGAPLLMVANEISGSTTIYEIVTPDGAGSLSLLHNNDGESTIQPLKVTVAPGSDFGNTETQTLNVAGVAAFKATTEREIAAARGLGNAVVNVYAGDAFLASAALQCTLDDADGPVYDAIAQSSIPYTAHVFGNHEFDYSPDFLKRFIDAFGGTQPFLGANLDFSGEAAFAAMTDSDGTLYSPLTVGDKILGGSLVYVDSDTNQRFGIVGITTPLLATISTPRGITVTPTITETAAAAQAAIDHLYDDLGVRKIILVSHLQDLSNDRALVGMLKRVDLAVAGGGDELLSNSSIPNTTELLPGDSPSQEDGADLPYPLVEQDADGRDVYIVTTNGNYKYVGRLDVAFNSAGEVSQVITAESYPRRVVEAGSAATALGISDAVTPDAGLVSSVVTPVSNCLATYAETPVVRSEVTLDVSRGGVRGKETNAGNLVADSFRAAYANYASNVGVTVPLNRVVAVQNGGGIRQNAGDVLPTSGTPGLISRLDTLNVLPFDNFVAVVQDVTPAELKAILERSAASLPGQGGQFLQVAGMRVTYDLSQTAQVVSTPTGSDVAGEITTAGGRVQSVILDDGTPLILQGSPLSGAPSVALVTNNFTARGGDNYPTFEDKPASSKVNLIDDVGVAISYEQAWREYLESFAKSGSPNLPTILSSDTRYAVGGEGRITLTEGYSIRMPFITTK